MKNTNFKTKGCSVLLIALGTSITYAQHPQGKEG